MKKEVISKAKYVRISPRKARLVVDLIRGKNAVDASEYLKFVNKKAALPIRKCLDSAISNAVNNENLNKSLLVITEARVDEAPTFKRGRAVSRGRYHAILKRNSHIIIKVAENSTEKQAKKDSKVVKSESPKKAKPETKKEEKKEIEVKPKKVAKKKTTTKKTK